MTRTDGASERAGPRLDYAILELGLRCNLRCVHCASGAGRPRAGELDREAWQAVVDDLAALGCRAVDLMGGEVLLSPLLDPVGEALQAKRIPWGTLTNGWLLDHRRAEGLLARGCRGIGVSLDGARAETHDTLRGRSGAFDRALAAIEVVAGLDLKPRNRSVLTSVNRRNVGELEAMGELLSRRFPGMRWQINLCSAEAPRLPGALRLDGDGVADVVLFIDRARREGRFDLEVTAAHDIGYFVDALDLYDHAWTGCPAGRHHLGVQSDGKVKGCLALEERFAVGRVPEARLADLWRDEARWAPWRTFSTDALGDGCRRCVWGSICRGGCTAYSTAMTGQAHDHPHCLWRDAPQPVRLRTNRAVNPIGDPEMIPCMDPVAIPSIDSASNPPAIGATAAVEDVPAIWSSPLRSACVELTLRCNLRCLHCGQAAGEARAAELDLAEVVTLLGDLRRLGGERVVLLGGEPLLHPDWAEIAMVARGFGLEVALITNGTPVTEKIAARLAGLDLARVGVSIDGAGDEVHDHLRGLRGARWRAWTAIERLRAVGLPVTVITTVCRPNLGELGALREQLRAASSDGRARPLVWQLQAANGTGERFSRELMLRPAEILEIARFIAATRREVPRDELAIAGGHNVGHHACTVRDYGTIGQWRGCPGGVTSVGVASDGTVKTCLSSGVVGAIGAAGAIGAGGPAETSGCAADIAGNIRTRSLFDLWRDPRSFARNRYFTPARLQGGCAACPHGATCRGGCPQMARTATGDVYDNPYCLRQIEGLAG